MDQAIEPPAMPELMRNDGSGGDSPVHVPPGGRFSLDERAAYRSPTDGSEAYQAVSPAVPSRLASNAGLDDQWEALDFSQPISFGDPQALLRELSAGEPGQVAARFAELQSRLGHALQEVDRLRGTVDQMHRDASAASLAADAAAAEEQPGPPQPLWRPAWEGFRRGFTLTYFVRAGLGLTTRALQLARQRQWGALAGWRLLSEEGLRYREDAVRLGLFVGGFTAIHALVLTHLRRRAAEQQQAAAGKSGRPRLADRASLLAGALAGVSLVVLDPERRRTLALYAAARAAQCCFHSAAAQGRLPLLRPRHGDSLLFALATAQVMYAYALAPETLPPSYWRFIVRTGPVHPVALEAVRRSLRGLPVDTAAVNAFVEARGGSRRLTEPFPRQIPAWVLDPRSRGWAAAAARAFAGTFRKTLPLYFSISVVPFAVLNLRRALRSPLGTLAHALLGSLRSTAFLAGFVGLYMGAVCLHRACFAGDFKQLYWLAGFLASGSVLAEKKARRAELALYVLPRAVQSACALLLRRRLLPRLPLWEVALFAACAGCLMHFREHEPETLAPLISSLLSRIVLGQPAAKSHPRAPLAGSGSGSSKAASPASQSPASEASKAAAASP